MPETVPEKPTGVKASSISNAGAFLTWDEAGGADIYRIYRKAEGDSNYDLVSTSTVPQINLTGLDEGRDRKSTRLNSSHVAISYAVFCAKKTRAGTPSSRR